MNPRARRFFPLLVAALAAVPFLPALGAGFLRWDDALYLLADDRWRGLSPAGLHWMWTTTRGGSYAPLAWLSYALDDALFGLSPRAFHATNVLLHAGCAGLFAAVLEELLARAAPRARAGERALAAAFGALLWAVHPQRVESVAWIAERRDVLCLFFSLLAVLFHLRRPGRPAVLFAYVLALLAKGSAIAVPPVLLVLDAWPLKRFPRGARAAVREKIPLFALALGFGLLGALGQSDAGALQSLNSAGPGERLALALRGFVFPLQKFFWPAELLTHYRVPPGFGLGSPAVLASALAVAALAAAAWISRRRVPAAPAALAQYALCLAPMLGLVRFGDQLTSDHASYAAMLGLAALGAGAFLAARRRAPRAAAASAAVLLLALGALTWRQSGYWRSDLALWSREAALDPDSLFARMNLASALDRAGRGDEAVAQERAAMRLDPGEYEAQAGLSADALARGRNAEAEAFARAALAVKPDYAPALGNLGAALLGEGRAPEAETVLLQAVGLAPGSAEDRSNLGLALLARGRAEPARVELELATRHAPDWAIGRYNLGDALSTLGREDEAASAFGEAARLAPRLEAAWVNGGNALARRGRFPEAAARFRRALALDPNDPDARRGLSVVARLTARP